MEESGSEKHYTDDVSGPPAVRDSLALRQATSLFRFPYYILA